MKDKKLILEMLESAKSLLQAAKDAVDNSEDAVAEKPKPVKKKRGRPAKKKPEPKPKEDFTVRQAESKTPKFSHNKFEEMMGLDVDKPEGYDKIDDSVSISPRNRGGYKPVSLTCVECNRSVDVNPIFKKDSYICDRCVGKKFGG